MKTFQGIAVSPGMAYGEAFVFDQQGYQIPRRYVRGIDGIDDELNRLRKSVASVSEGLTRNRDAVANELGDKYGAIFSAQHQMLCDPKLQCEIETEIRERSYSVEYAVSSTLQRYAKVFQNLGNEYMAERAHDIVDIEKRLMADLLGNQREVLQQLESPVIVLAHNLTPSETANLDRQNVLGFASELGGAGGHTAIVAEALEIPAVVGMGRILPEISSGDLLIIDGDKGLIIVDPDEPTIQRYRESVAAHRSQTERLGRLRDKPAKTKCGQRIHLKANIEFPSEADVCIERGADGIGLYRTEFLYLGKEHRPTEENHYEAYVKVIEAMAGKPVVIRTLDLGSDKIDRHPDDYAEKNPFLGLRSIRLSLRDLSLFKTQLRAILRASALGDVSVMFPLISTLQELRRAKSILADIMEDLEEENLPFNRDIKIGMMVEVPATVMLMDRFVKEVDFISIGTNDLIQYTLAVDRSNKDVASLYTAADPSILHLIKLSVVAADAQSIPVALCGQMSASSTYTMLLLGLGLRTLSLPSHAIPEIKNICRNVNIKDCQQIANKALDMESAMEIKTYLKQELANALPG